MCGICGILNLDGSPVDGEVLERMTGALNHRGPDGGGIFIDDNVSLGHRRLSIIDLSERADQPMTNEDGTLHLVYNGEIYNFKELRNVLEKKNHVFGSESDTEVILHQYEEEGEECVRSFIGMFAFALWDSRRKRLFLARDRLGKKPIVYYHDKSVFVFSSEMQSLLQHPGINRRISPEALHHYLTFQYVPSPHSAVEGVRKLPPGHIMRVEGGEARARRYWNLSFAEKLDFKGARDYEESFYDLFTDAVKMRLVSDVPLGVFLSGGIDSSAVVSVMSSLLKGGLETFSIGFEESDFDEAGYAREVSDFFKTAHREFRVLPDAVSLLPKIARHYGEPFADPSAIPTFYLSEATRRYVTVALNGDGGDETFAGYLRYKADKLSACYRILPRFIREGMISRAVYLLPSGRSQKSAVRRM